MVSILNCNGIIKNSSNLDKKQIQLLSTSVTAELAVRAVIITCINVRDTKTTLNLSIPYLKRKIYHHSSFDFHVADKAIFEYIEFLFKPKDQR